MRVVGRLLRGVRSSVDASPLARPEFAASTPITVASPSFANGGPIPQKHAGPRVGQNISPALRWSGVPTGARQLVVLMDDVDVPLPKPLFHTIAVLEPGAAGLGEGELRAGTTGLRIVPTALGRDGYSGPRPIPGHGPHHYRFHVLALDLRVPDDATSARRLLDAIAGHVIARGTLTGSYER
ncbi:MAG TPA: YbhB/YbcL family Raf kinase inhibitor-like protein [Mycobacterium sp.]|jgi:hypothetical protein|nr:YbhB/YbcL family Raf kinase inhibitor-like protein [Mycobacterium sp.]